MLINLTIGLKKLGFQNYGIEPILNVFQARATAEAFQTPALVETLVNRRPCFTTRMKVLLLNQSMPLQLEDR
jgi:hypothetical protein